jgi:hypothetical protein
MFRKRSKWENLNWNRRASLEPPQHCGERLVAGPERLLCPSARKRRNFCRSCVQPIEIKFRGVHRVLDGDSIGSALRRRGSSHESLGPFPVFLFQRLGSIPNRTKPKCRRDSFCGGNLGGGATGPFLAYSHASIRSEAVTQPYAN